MTTHAQVHAASLRRRLAPHVATLGLALLVLGAAALLRLDRQDRVLLPFGKQHLPAMCAVWRTTGEPCAGCGLTRAFIELAHGRFRPAADRHAAAPLLFTLLVVQLPLQLYQMLRVLRGRPRWPVERWSLAALLAIVGGIYLHWFMA